MSNPPSERFARVHRSLDAVRFPVTLRQGRRIRGDYLRLTILRTARDRGRLGLAVGRASCRDAVGRNYMKRALREIFRRHPVDFTGLDVVVAPRREFRREAFTAVSRELRSLIRNFRWPAS